MHPVLEGRDPFQPLLLHTFCLGHCQYEARDATRRDVSDLMLAKINKADTQDSEHNLMTNTTKFLSNEAQKVGPWRKSLQSLHLTSTQSYELLFTAGG